MAEEQKEIQREKGKMQFRSQLVGMVNERLEHSAQTFAPNFKRMGRYYDLYRQQSQTKYHAYRNHVTVPLGWQIVQASVAAKMSMMFGGSPYITFVGGGPEDQAQARMQQALVNRQLEDARVVNKAVKFLTMAEVYGTAVFRWFWRREEGKTAFRIDRGRGEELIEEDVLNFDGPDWEPVDPLDFFPCPGYGEIDDMPWVIHRYYMDIEDVQVAAERGFFDKEGVEDLKWSPGMSGESDDVSLTQGWRKNRASGNFMDSPAKADKYSRMVEIVEMWGRVPRNLTDDGEGMRVVTLGNRTELLRNDPIPHSNRKIPFGSYSPTPDPHYFHAPGKIEVISKLQYATNRLANHKLDALDLSIDPMWLASRRSGLDPRNVRTRPGGILWADREVGPELIQPLRPDLSGLQNTYVELEQQNQWMQKGTGIIDDTVQGLSAANRTTAREFQGRMEAASRRIIHEVRGAEATWLEPLAQAFVRMNRQFLTFPATVRVLGANAVLDPVTLQPIEQPGVVQVGVNDMLPEYDVRAVGSTRAVGLAARQQNLVLLLQAVQANPIAAASLNWVAFFRMLFRTFEIENVDELMQTDPLMQMVAMMAMQGGMGGMDKPQGTDNAGEPVKKSPKGSEGGQ